MHNKKTKIETLYHHRKLVARFIKALFIKKFMPVIANINITKLCNLKCIHCYAALDTLSNCADPTTEEIMRLIDKCYEIGVRLIRLMGGEPLMRKDIGIFIRYIKSKGMACELITNGIFIPRYIEELKPLDLLCISIDGGRQENDFVRGEGTWEKIMAGIRAAVKAGITPRLHCILTRYTIHSLGKMTEISNELGLHFNLGECVFETYPDPNFTLTEDQQQDFYHRYLEARRSNQLISSSTESIITFLNWPSRNKVITYDEAKKNPKIKKTVPECQFGHKEIFIDVDGMVYPCVRLWKKGVNYKTAGLEQAWKRVSESRYCYVCKEVGCIERALAYGGNIKVMIKAYLGFF